MHVQPEFFHSSLATQGSGHLKEEESFKALCDKLTTSMAITVILSYLEIEEAIHCQILNKHMYYYKTPAMASVVIGRRIESDIVIYSEYKNQLGAVSVVIGRAPPIQVGFGGSYKKECQLLINKFLTRNPMFAKKYTFEGHCWPMCEDRRILIAVFQSRAMSYFAST